MSRKKHDTAAGLKADLHLHTCEGPREAFLSYDSFQIIDTAMQQGYDVCAITNHDTVTWSSYLSDYARERGILLIPGIEITLDRKHILAYSTEPESLCRSTLEGLHEANDRNTLYIAPHPFFPGPSSLGSKLFAWRTLFDAVEVCHLYLSFLNFNQKAIAAAGTLGLPLVGTSDAHTMQQLGTTYARIFAEKDPASLIEAVKAGAVDVVTEPLSPARMAGIVLELCGRAVVYKLRTGKTR